MGRQALSSAIGLDDEESFRILFDGRDLCEGDSVSENAFKNQLGDGKPCIVRILFRLLGGKGGFGALLRKQANKGKKTKNFDAMRDLTGRRLRHSYAVDRIKEWMEKQNKEDELVNLIAGEGPELPKPVPAAESLDPEFVRQLKRSAATRPAVVSEGMRALESEGQDPAKKRSRTDGPADNAASSSSSSGAAPVMKALTALDTLADLSGSSSEAASPDGEEVEEKSMPAQAPQPKKATAAASSISSSAAASASSAAEIGKTASASASSASALAEAIADSFCAATEAADEGSAKAPRSRGGSASETVAPTDATPVKCLTPQDLAKFKNADELVAKVDAETLKQSLQKLGLKCGGTPEDRAKRFFLLKSTPLEEIPKKEFAKK